MRQASVVPIPTTAKSIQTSSPNAAKSAVIAVIHARPHHMSVQPPSQPRGQQLSLPHVVGAVAVFGGGCCGYGFMCTTSGQCVSTQTTTSAPVVTAIPSGCSAATQFSCAASQGGGCCDNGYVCTVLENTNYCAFATGTAVKTRTGTGGILATAVPADSSSSALSTGAKAGIGVGVSLVALAIIGALMWFCLVHRRMSLRRSHGSEVPNGSKTGSKRPSAGRQPSQPSDYFGPTAGIGPFTEEHTSTDVSPGYDRGVPAVPHGPDDIASPVEIDTTEHSTVTSPGVERPKFPVENAFELP
jgi:hypothetical protein